MLVASAISDDATINDDVMLSHDFLSAQNNALANHIEPFFVCPLSLAAIDLRPRHQSISFLTVSARGGG